VSDPADELAADLVLALRRAVASGVTLAREDGGYRVVSANRQLAVIVFDDGSTSPLVQQGDRSSVPASTPWDTTVRGSDRLSGPPHLRSHERERDDATRC
jgi:hypothetical protein